MKTKMQSPKPHEVSLRDRIAKVHNRYLSDLETAAQHSKTPGVALKVVCACQLLNEARASLTAQN